MLIDTPKGILNTDHIVRVEPTAAGNANIVRFVDGTTLVLDRIVDIERACGTVIAAQPGFDFVSALLPGDGESGILYNIEAVIAFRIGAGAFVPTPEPITASGEPPEASDLAWTVRQPNGRCCGPDGTFDDLDGFKACCERMVEERPQRSA